MSRLIARLDIKDTQLVKGIQFEGLRKYGDVKNFVEKYYSLGVHELFMSDVMASLYGRTAKLMPLSEVQTRLIPQQKRCPEALI